MLAADGDGMAVTGVTFWDGDENDLQIYKHKTKVWNDHGSCSCCLESNIVSSHQNKIYKQVSYIFFKIVSSYS